MLTFFRKFPEISREKKTLGGTLQAVLAKLWKPRLAVRPEARFYTLKVSGFP